jgi:hypothetical protein
VRCVSEEFCVYHQGDRATSDTRKWFVVIRPGISPRNPCRPWCAPPSYNTGIFVVTEADAAAIHDVFHQEGELSAAIELRRRFPGITDNAKARACARTITGWVDAAARAAPPGDAAAPTEGPASVASCGRHLPYPVAFLQELRARTRLYADRPEDPAGGRRTHMKGCCPFHGEKLPSFFVYDDAFYCFGCGAHGDAICFVMQTEGVGFFEADAPPRLSA